MGFETTGFPLELSRNENPGDFRVVGASKLPAFVGKPPGPWKRWFSRGDVHMLQPFSRHDLL